MKIIVSQHQLVLFGFKIFIFSKNHSQKREDEARFSDVLITILIKEDGMDYQNFAGVQEFGPLFSYQNQ